MKKLNLVKTSDKTAENTLARSAKNGKHKHKWLILKY